MSLRRRPLAALVVFLVAMHPATASLQAPSIRTDDLREWLTYIASDQLQGRADYSPGLGLAAAYIEDHLRAWGVKPAGDPGSYLQTVQVLGVRSTSHCSVTVQVGTETRTFKDGEGVSFPHNTGAKRTVAIDRVEFVAYGLNLPAINHNDFLGKNVEGEAVVWLGARGPKEADGQLYRGLVAERNRYATEELRSAATIAPEVPPGERRAGLRERAGAAGSPGGPSPDFTTSERLDKPLPPSVTANDAFLSFLFSHAPVTYEELKQRSEAREALPSFRLDHVKITFNISTDYEVIRTQLLQNVVGIVEGRDPQLKATYVAFGAHYDHVGYAEGEVGADGMVQPPLFGLRGSTAGDRIWNGADDDGSGTVALLALAKAFATESRPKRSLLFVWHAGEEIGTFGSLYFADHPTVPIDSIVAQLNIDMIGRNRDDKPSEANTVYLVGSDRISSELHEISREANRSAEHPLTLDYELNDPSDPEQFYYRSDHHSYAAKGIPVIFFTTGMQPDYHRNSDEVSKILFDKLTRITQFVYDTGVRLADLDHEPVRDRKGPRAGKDTK